MKIYVAGPYSAKTTVLHDIPFEVQKNVTEAVQYFWKLTEKGHIVYIPHLSHYLCINAPDEAMKYHNVAGDQSSFWYVFDLRWLDSCDAIFMMPNWKTSSGAVMEEKYSREHGKQVFYSLDEVPLTTKR